MSPRRLLAALVVTLLLIGAAVVVEVVLPRRRAESEAAERVLLARGAPLRDFAITRDGTRLAFTPRPEGGWRLDAPQSPRPLEADTRAVDEVQRALSGFAGVSAVLAEGEQAEASLGKYELASPRLLLEWTDDRSRARSLALGSLVAEDQVAALLDGHRLVLLPRAVRDVADRDLAVFRNKSLLSLEWQDIRRLEIDRGGVIPQGVSPRIVAERADPASGASPDAWRMLEPAPRDANPTRLGSIVSKISTLTAGSFGVEQPDQDALARSGLTPPVVSVLVVRGDGPPVRVAFGTDATDELAWGRVDEGPLVGLRADLRADLLLPDPYYRDNRPVRLPRWNIMNLRLSKGVDEDRISLELQKDDAGAWYAVQPQGVELEDSEGGLLLSMLEEVQCGRFEDELSATPGASDMRWDFKAPGSLEIRASALLADGRPLRVDLDAVPFLYQRTTYHAVRTIDQEGREEVCIAGIKAFDPLLARVRLIVARGRGATGASGPPAPQ